MDQTFFSSARGGGLQKRPEEEEEEEVVIIISLPRPLHTHTHSVHIYKEKNHHFSLFNKKKSGRRVRVKEFQIIYRIYVWISFLERKGTC